MKTITLKEAIDILSQCSAVIIDNVVTYPSLHEHEEFLNLSWTDGEYNDFNESFYARDNENVIIVDSSMFLVDESGDEVQLTILCPQKLD